jgi:hypothetical protein
MRLSRWLAAALACTALGIAMQRASAGGPPVTAYGERRVAQYRIPADALGRTPWNGPLDRVGQGRNPYRLVLTVDGVTQAAGPVRSRWQAGWSVSEGANATRDVVMALTAAAAQPAVAAGEASRLTLASGPVSFRGEREVEALLGLVELQNLDLREVTLEVWSGAPPLGWRDAVVIQAAALLGFLGVALALLMRRR